MVDGIKRNRKRVDGILFLFIFSMKKKMKFNVEFRFAITARMY